MIPREKQTILITGSTDGIGELTAHKLAQQGARVLIHGRNEQKVHRVAQQIQNKTGNQRIEQYIADFSSLDNVRRLASQISSQHEKLDVLINNAGIGFSEDGYMSYAWP